MSFNLRICRQKVIIADDALTTGEILIVEKYMREKPLDEINQRDNNRSEMLEKFQLTRQSRRAFVTGAKTSATTFLNKYPRLKDMKEAVS